MQFLQNLTHTSQCEISKLNHHISTLTNNNKALEEQVIDIQRRMQYLNVNLINKKQRELDTNRNKFRIVLQEKDLLQNQYKALEVIFLLKIGCNKGFP